MRQNEDGVSNELLFKLGAIGTEVRGIAENLNSAIRRLEIKIEDSSRHHSEAVNDVKERLRKSEAKIEFLEQWRQQLFTKLGFVISGVSVFWLTFGKPLEGAVKTVFGG